jgi:Tol biopolymer transport system component
MRTAVILCGAAVAIAGCQIQRRPAPVGVGVLEVKDVARATDRPALSPIAWSADGQRFAYGTRDGVWVHGVGDGKGARIADGGVVTAVAWSGPADMIAYVDRGVLSTVRPDGRNRRTIGLPGFVTAIAWAPGGDRLAAVVRVSDGQDDHLMWTSPEGTMIRHIQWEPRGKRIVGLGWFPDTLHLFVALAPPGGDVTTEWWSIRIAYPDFVRVTGPARPILDPILSPSGQWMAFVAAEGNRHRAFAVRTDGTGLHPMSPPVSRIAGLAWSRGSDKIAYGVILNDTQAEVHIVGVTGAPSQLVATYRVEFPDPAVALSVVWAPDDAHLAYGTNTGSLSGPVWLARLER